MKALFHRFARARDGFAAVEFGFVVPVLLVMFFGVEELSLALSCRADVTNVASTAADLTAQASTVSTTDMTNVFDAASAILYPYSTASAKITVSSVIYNTTSKSLTSGTVAWSCTRNGSTRSGSMNLPSGLMTVNGSVIVSEISYAYTSPTTKIISNPMAMTNTFYTKPRRIAQITGPTGNCNL